MPRFLVETRPIATDLAALLVMVRSRFPEVALERRFTLGGAAVGDTWVCRAASAAHVRRWAAAAGLDVEALHPIQADDDLVGDGRI